MPCRACPTAALFPAGKASRGHRWVACSLWMGGSIVICCLAHAWRPIQLGGAAWPARTLCPPSPARSSDGAGLQTGDASLNIEAPVVVMTTEILRNMLYRVDDDGRTADERLKVGRSAPSAPGGSTACCRASTGAGLLPGAGWPGRASTKVHGSSTHAPPRSPATGMPGALHACLAPRGLGR